MSVDDMSYEAFENATKRYGRKVHEEYNINVPLSMVEFGVWNEESRTIGRAFNRGDHYIIKLNYMKYLKNSWEKLKETMRHEWAHVIQYHVSETDGHGATFHYLADKLDFSKEDYENTLDTKFRIRCPDCDHTTTKSRECKSVRMARERKIYCHKCYERKNEKVYMNLERVNTTEALKKLKENAFKDEDNQNKTWKDEAMSNLQMAKNQQS